MLQLPRGEEAKERIGDRKGGGKLEGEAVF